MPQKKNPDIAELARGKSGRFIGNLTGLLATLKALPLAYDRDLQEDKEPVFDTVDQLLVLLPAVTGMVATLHVRTVNGSRRRRRRVSPWPPMSPSGWCDRACRSGRRTRSPARFVAVLRATRPSNSTSSADAELAELDPRLTPRRPRRCSRSPARFAARSAVGGTAPARVAEQSATLADVVHDQVAWANARLGDELSSAGGA